MTDQATEQSGSVEAAPGDAQKRDLAAMFQAALSGEQTKQVQADTEQREQAQADDGEIPSEAGEQAEATEQPEMIRVPSLEGDGWEELPAAQVKAERLMHADYTRKTQAIAEKAKAVEAKARQVEQAQTAKLAELDNQLQIAALVFQSFEQNVDWKALREVDPSAFLEAKEAQANRARLLQQAAQHAQQVKAQYNQQRKAEEAQRLVEAIPEWLDKAKAKAEATELLQGVTAYGFTAEEFDNVLDHRMVLMARDALEFRKLKAKAADVKATVAKAPPMSKPGAAKQGNPQALQTFKAIQRATTTKSNDDIAAAFALALRKK